jgi:hypothetical protein
MAKMFRYMHIGRAGITQLVEYQLPKLKVAGSSPVARSIFHTSLMTRRTRMLPVLLAVALGLAGLLACGGPSKSVNQQGPFDQAVAKFVAGDYRGTISRMEKIVAATTDEAVKRDAYAYIGRSHMALGETDEAIEAFTMGTHYGDRGPCVEYLEMLKQYVEGNPNALHMREGVTRSELAGAIVRMMDETATAGLTPGGPTPLAILAGRGWMPAAADGAEHADDEVTRASLYVIVTRILAGRGQAAQIDAIMPGGYGAALRAADSVSGTEALAILEKVRQVPEKNGR